jgi:PHD/YefM family antitoxin component YafN of YafNO toxin-antitoxin module
MNEVQYITDDLKNITGVIVPIDLWHELQSEKETAYLLKSEAMKERLFEARKRDKGIPLVETCEKLGI